MNFSSAAVDGVYAEYEARVAREREKAAELGPAMFSRLDEFLLAVGPEVGAVLHSLILARRPARILELGTSYGYSTLFLADAAKQVGARLISMDIADFKQAHARSMMDKAGLLDVVEFRLGDAVAGVTADPGPFDFVLLDIWKDLYLPCLEVVYPKLSDEGVLATDNIIEPAQWRTAIREYRATLAALPGMQSVLLPIGNGVELSVKWSAGNPKL